MHPFPEVETLAHLPRRAFLPGTPAEWSGLFLFGVGVYGAAQRPLTRHLTLYGVIPLDWFYLVLLLVGAGLMLFGGPLEEPEAYERAMRSGWSRFFAGVRLGASLSLLAILVWWAIVR